MEYVDRFYIDSEVGEEVEVNVQFPADDDYFGALDDPVITTMIITRIDPYFTQNGSFLVELMIPGDYDTDIYRMQMHPGEHFRICVGETRRVVRGVRIDRKPNEGFRPRLSKQLVNLKKGNKAMISAKYEAYMDPEVAAMAETPALITRNKAYQRIEC